MDLVLLSTVVGSSLKDQGDFATENFVSEQDAAFYARLYQSQNIRGGHIILLNPKQSEFYEATKAQAIKALGAYPGGLQIGVGINAENAPEFIEAGAQAVIVTSYVSKDGCVNYENLNKIKKDVVSSKKITDVMMLQSVVRFLADNIGNISDKQCRHQCIGRQIKQETECRSDQKQVGQ